MRKRNFVIFYTAFYEEDMFFGHEAIQTENGQFISWNRFRKMMIEDLGYKDVFITSVMELTSKDYNTWIENES